MEYKEMTIAPEGDNTGRITASQETTHTFNNDEGPVPVVTVTITPDLDGENVQELKVHYGLGQNPDGSTYLSNLSAFAALCNALNVDYKAKGFQPDALVGTAVGFRVVKNGSWSNVVKDSIHAL